MNEELYCTNLTVKLKDRSFIKITNKYDLDDNREQVEKCFRCTFVSSKIIGPFKVDDSININAENSSKF